MSEAWPVTVTTGNRQIAAQARDIADKAPTGSVRRKAALCAVVALGESRTLVGARKVLREWDGPQHIRDQAGQLLDDLTREEEPCTTTHTERNAS